MIGRAILHARGGDAESYEGIAWLSWVATVFTAGLFTALAAIVLFNLCVEFGATPGGAMFAALTYGVATPMWTLATLFIGHAFSAACLVFAFAAAARMGKARLQASMMVNGLIVGLAAGWATVSEFPAAVPAVILAIYAAINVWPLGREHAVKVLGALVAGAMACALVLMAYQYACFGSPFHIAYSSEQAGFEGMQTGVFGVHWPSVDALWRILLGGYRGLLPLAPVLIFAPLGLVTMIRLNPDTSIGVTGRAAMVAASIALYYVLLNASYTYWEGGWSYGPRHLSPAIPFLCLGLAMLWTIAPSPARAVLAAFSAYGAALSLVAVATMAQPPASILQPMRDLLLPAFRDGDLALNSQRFTDSGASSLRAHTEPKAAWNLGMKVGLDGHASLIPLAIIWLGAGVAIIGAGSAGGRASTSADSAASAPRSPGSSARRGPLRST
jgi:hypothetical protein